MNNIKANWVTTVIALIIGLSGLAVALSVDTTDDGNGHKKTTITFRVDKSGSPGTQTQAVTASAPVVAAVQTNLEGNLKDETPLGAPPAQIQANQDKATEVQATLPALPTGGATAGVPGCRTQFVQNQSSRNGIRPIWFVLHYTVSPNVPGWGDVNAVVALFNRSSSQASSHFVLDAEGHCAYIVPIENKAWTEAAGNSLGVSVEIIATGKETKLCTGPCLAELRVIFRTVSARTGIKSQTGSIYPAIGGIVQHKDGGLAWGGHIDITPFDSKALASQVLAGVKPSQKSVWIKHRLAIHNTYQQKCKHKYQRERRPVTCAKLRKDAKKLDHLIARKKA